MNLFELILALLGLAFSLFIPGYLLSTILIKRLDMLARIVLSVVFSISIDILTGILAGPILNIPFTAATAWIMLLFVTVVLVLVRLAMLPAKDKRELFRRLR